MEIAYDALAPVLRGTESHEDFVVVVNQIPTAVGGSSSTLVQNDVTWDTQISSSSDNNFAIAASEAEFSSETPAVCSVDSTGHAVRVSDGQCNILIRVAGLGTRRYSQQMSLTGSTTIRTGVQSLANGSLIKYLTDQRSALLAAVAPTAANQRAYVNADGSGGINTANMLLRSDIAGFTPLDLAPILANSWRYITPKHRIVTYHTNPSQYWSANDFGQIIAGNTDTAIVYEKLSNRSNICKLMPANWRSYLPTMADSLLDIPAWARRLWVGSDPVEKFWVQAVSKSDNRVRLPVNAVAETFAHPTNGSLGVGGDSGTPVFVGINGNAVLVGQISYSGGILNGEYGDNISAINAALVATATAGGDANPSQYAALTVDLSGFTAYP